MRLTDNTVIKKNGGGCCVLLFFITVKYGEKAIRIDFRLKKVCFPMMAKEHCSYSCYSLWKNYCKNIWFTNWSELSHYLLKTVATFVNLQISTIFDENRRFFDMESEAGSRRYAVLKGYNLSLCGLSNLCGCWRVCGEATLVYRVQALYFSLFSLSF